MELDPDMPGPFDSWDPETSVYNGPLPGSDDPADVGRIAADDAAPLVHPCDDCIKNQRLTVLVAMGTGAAIGALGLWILTRG